MPLQILSSPPPEPEEVATALHQRIRAALPDAEIEVRPESPGHFSIRVRSASFRGLSRVRQHQQVYAAIRELMSGDAAPVHAVDSLTTQTP